MAREVMRPRQPIPDAKMRRGFSLEDRGVFGHRSRGAAKHPAGSNPTGGLVPRTRKRAAKRRSGTMQAGSIGPLKPGNGGPPDDQVKCCGPGRSTVRGIPTPAGSDTDDRASELGADVLHRRAAQESGLGVVNGATEGESHAGIDGRMAVAGSRGQGDQEQLDGAGGHGGELTQHGPPASEPRSRPASHCWDIGRRSSSRPRQQQDIEMEGQG